MSTLSKTALNLIEGGDLPCRMTGDANRVAQNDPLLSIRSFWNSSEVASIEAQAGVDTTNKDDGEWAFFTGDSGTLTEVLRLLQTKDVKIMAGNLNIAAALKGLQFGGNAVLTPDASGKVTLTSYGANQNLDLDANGTGLINCLKDIKMAAGKGISFDPYGAGKLLNDYEEGTFSWTVSSGVTGATFANNIGYYNKVGRQVYIYGLITLNGGAPDGNAMKFGNLPFVAVNDGVFWFHGSSYLMSNLSTPPADTGSVLPRIVYNTSDCQLMANTNNGTTGHSIIGDVFTNAGSIQFTALYITA